MKSQTKNTIRYMVTIGLIAMLTGHILKDYTTAAIILISVCVTWVLINLAIENKEIKPIEPNHPVSDVEMCFAIHQRMFAGDAITEEEKVLYEKTRATRPPAEWAWIMTSKRISDSQQ